MRARGIQEHKDIVEEQKNKNKKKRRRTIIKENQGNIRSDKRNRMRRQDERGKEKEN